MRPPDLDNPDLDSSHAACSGIQPQGIDCSRSELTELAAPTVGGLSSPWQTDCVWQPEQARSACPLLRHLNLIVKLVTARSLVDAGAVLEEEAAEEVVPATGLVTASADYYPTVRCSFRGGNDHTPCPKVFTIARP